MVDWTADELDYEKAEKTVVDSVEKMADCWVYAWVAKTVDWWVAEKAA